MSCPLSLAVDTGGAPGSKPRFPDTSVEGVCPDGPLDVIREHLAGIGEGVTLRQRAFGDRVRGGSLPCPGSGPSELPPPWAKREGPRRLASNPFEQQGEDSVRWLLEINRYWYRRPLGFDVAMTRGSADPPLAPGQILDEVAPVA